MAKSNLIVNGDFTLGNQGWSGTDLETNHAEGAYLGNGSSNRVAEMDGNRNAVTQMTQTVTIPSGVTTDLTFSSALRKASVGNAGKEGFRVEITDAQGQTVATQSFYPTTTSWATYSMPVTFPAGNTRSG